MCRRRAQSRIAPAYYSHWSVPYPLVLLPAARSIFSQRGGPLAIAYADTLLLRLFASLVACPLLASAPSCDLALSPVVRRTGHNRPLTQQPQLPAQCDPVRTPAVDSPSCLTPSTSSRTPTVPRSVRSPRFPHRSRTPPLRHTAQEVDLEASHSSHRHRRRMTDGSDRRRID
jgi:hypothetical protein